MAYVVEEIFEKAKEVIRDNDLIFVEEIVSFLPISKNTFYKFFPIESDEYDELRNMIDDNKTRIKASIRKKLWASEKAAELLALYRLTSTSEEHKLLNQSYHDHTTKGKELKSTPTFLFSDLNEDEET